MTFPLTAGRRKRAPRDDRPKPPRWPSVREQAAFVNAVRACLGLDPILHMGPRRPRETTTPIQSCPDPVPDAE